MNETWWEDSTDCVIRHIPFYDGKRVRKIIGGGRLRGRGSRRFKRAMRPPHKYYKSEHNPTGVVAYKYQTELDVSLPHHLSTMFTLYHTEGGRHKIYFDFQRFNSDGKLVIRLVNS